MNRQTTNMALREQGVDLVDMSGANNLFGSLAKGQFPFQTGMDFIPVDNEGGIMKTGEGHQPQWLGLNSHQMQYWAYRYCPPLASVIDRSAEADTNGRLEFRDSKGVTVSNVNKNPKLKRIRSLFLNPNPWQTFEEWNAQQVIIAKNFGYCIVWAIGGILDKSMSTCMINISPNNATPQANEELDIYSELEEDNNPIKTWRLSVFGKHIEVPSEDILIIRDGYVDSEVGKFGLPLSKVAGLDYSISNICAAMEADNVLLKKKGPLGVFSHEGVKDPAGVTPMTQTVQDDLQNQLKRYGLTVGQLQYIVSRSGLKWNAMSFNLRDLMTKETIRQCIDNICDRFGYPAELMSGKNATYENRTSAEKFFYQTVVIPFSLRRMAKYNKFFGLEEYVLYMDYNHLPILQEDIFKTGQAAEANANALILNWQAGLITFNEYRLGLKMDTVDWGTIYFPEYIIKFPSMAPQQKQVSNGKDKKSSEDK